MAENLQWLFAVDAGDTTSDVDAYDQLYAAAAEALNAFEPGMGDLLDDQWQQQAAPWSARLPSQPTTCAHFAKVDRTDLGPDDPSPPPFGYCLDVLVNRVLVTETEAEQTAKDRKVRRKTKSKDIKRKDLNPDREKRKKDRDLTVRTLGNVEMVDRATVEFRRHRFAERPEPEPEGEGERNGI